MPKQRGSYVHFYGAFVVVAIVLTALYAPLLFGIALALCVGLALLRVSFLIREGRRFWQGRDWRGRPIPRPRPMSDEELYFGYRARRR